MADDARRSATAWRNPAWRTTLRRAPRREAEEAEFVDPLPQDENWMAELRAQPGHEAQVAPGPGPISPLAWSAMEDVLGEQRALIEGLVEKVDALENSMADVSDRLPRGRRVQGQPGSRSRWRRAAVLLARSTPDVVGRLATRGGR